MIEQGNDYVITLKANQKSGVAESRDEPGRERDIVELEGVK